MFVCVFQGLTNLAPLIIVWYDGGNRLCGMSSSLLGFNNMAVCSQLYLFTD